MSDLGIYLLSQINEIPKLTSGCTEFIESAENILEKRKMNQTMLSNHSTLLDLLEIPQLMDTYVKKINYAVKLVKFLISMYQWSHMPCEYVTSTSFVRSLANSYVCRCVRNGNYDEALDLEAYVGKLSTMHPK